MGRVLEQTVSVGWVLFVLLLFPAFYLYIKDFQIKLKVGCCWVLSLSLSLSLSLKLKVGKFHELISISLHATVVDLNYKVFFSTWQAVRGRLERGRRGTGVGDGGEGCVVSRINADLMKQTERCRM